MDSLNISLLSNEDFETLLENLEKEKDIGKLNLLVSGTSYAECASNDFEDFISNIVTQYIFENSFKAGYDPVAVFVMKDQDGKWARPDSFSKKDLNDGMLQLKGTNIRLRPAALCNLCKEKHRVIGFFSQGLKVFLPEHIKARSEMLGE